MNKNNLYWIIPISFFVGFILSFYMILFVESKQLEKYDLYNCIYNNAVSNNFNQNPIMVNRIQDECICFREHNYTNLMEANCSR